MNEISIVETAKNFSKIVIYGTGGIGEGIYSILEDNNLKVSYYVTSKLDPKIPRQNGLQVIEIAQISNNDKDNSLLIIAGKSSAQQLYVNAFNLGWKNIYKPTENELNFIETTKVKLRNQMMNHVFNSIDLSNKRILIIAPHPDDEVIGCGGLLNLYHDNIDVLCISSSGVAYPWDTKKAEEIAEERASEFEQIMKKLGINKFYIPRIWGIPPMFHKIEKHIGNYLTHFDFSIYDYIFAPHILDNHREHRYVAKYLLPLLLSKSHPKKNVKIASYEVWATISDPNFYLDISEVIDKKQDSINSYVSRIKGKYALRMTGLNQYRGQLANTDYAEAFRIYDLDEYLPLCKDNDWSR